MRSLVDFALAVGAKNLKTDSPENHSNPAKRNDFLPHAALRLKTGKPFIPGRRVRLHRLPKAKRLIRASTSRRGPSSTKISGAKHSLNLQLPRPPRGRRAHLINLTKRKIIRTHPCVQQAPDVENRLAQVAQQDLCTDACTKHSHKRGSSQTHKEGPQGCLYDSVTS